MEPIIINGELYHHGIMGMKWGQRNGPPYPLKSGMHTDLEMGQAKKKVGTLAGYFKDKKLKKKRAKALEKARQARAEKKAYDEAKDKALKSGNATELMKYSGDLSPEQIANALNRISMERQLAEYAKNDMSPAEQKVDKVLTKLGRAADWAEKGIKFYNVASKVANSVSGEEILPPIQNPMERINYKRGIEQLRSDKAQADIKEKESKKMDYVIGQAKATRDNLENQAKTSKQVAKQAKEETKRQKEATKSMKRGYTAQDKYNEKKAKEQEAKTAKDLRKEAKKQEKEARKEQRRIDTEVRNQKRIEQKELNKEKRQDNKLEKIGNKIISEQNRSDEKRKDISKNYENDLRNAEYDYLKSLMDAANSGSDSSKKEVAYDKRKLFNILSKTVDKDKNYKNEQKRVFDSIDDLTNKFLDENEKKLNKKKNPFRSGGY